MTTQRSQLHISEAAQLVGVTVKTIRHYHKLGLVTEPERSEGGYRLYNAADLQRLMRIKRLQTVGLSLRQIRFILEADDPDKMLHTMLKSIREDLDQQIQRLQRRKERIDLYLTEQATLTIVEQNEVDPQMFQQLAAIMHPHLDNVPPEAIAFDRAFFGRLEAYNWPPAFSASLVAMMQQVADDPHLLNGYRLLMDHLLSLADVVVDDPRVVNAAWEVAESEMGKYLRQAFAVDAPVQDAIQLAMEGVVDTLTAEMLSPAQIRFMQLLNRMFTR